jgi:glutathione peroxidase
MAGYGQYGHHGAIAMRKIPRILRTGTTGLLGLLLAVAALPGVAQEAAGLLDRSYRPLAGKTPVHLGRAYGGDVLLVVNTASKCGFTPQFEGLEAMHARYRARGFAVLGFPSGDFKEQEFEDEEEIREFCTLTYGVKFPMFEKVHVAGPQATPLYKALERATGEVPKWNFHKYLVGRDGRVLASWGSRTTPDDPELVAAVERALAAPRPAGN